MREIVDKHNINITLVIFLLANFIYALITRLLFNSLSQGLIKGRD